MKTVIQEVKTGRQPIPNLKGHLNIDYDKKTISYDIDRSLPLIVVGGLPLAKLQEDVKKAEESGQTGLRIAIRGGDALVMDKFHFDKLEYLVRVFTEIKEDFEKILDNVKKDGHTEFMPVEQTEAEANEPIEEVVPEETGSVPEEQTAIPTEPTENKPE